MIRKYGGFIALVVVAGAAFWWQASDTARNYPPDATTGGSAAPARPATPVAQGEGFDFYVLSLSWSPTFCEGRSDARSEPQCERGVGRGFVVHGLWPQNERGYPQFCESSQPQRVADALGRTMLDIMPSMGLIGHQWRKHGTCSGLSQRDYLAVTRAAFERIGMPAALSDASRNRTMGTADLESAFVSANPGLSRGAIAATCEGARLEEVRICLTKTLEFRDCREVDRQGCSSAQIMIPQSP